MIRVFQKSAALFGVLWFFWTTAFILPGHLHPTASDPCAHHASEDSHNSDRPLTNHHDCQLCRVDGQLAAIITPTITVQAPSHAAESVLADEYNARSRSVFSLTNKAPPVLS